MRMSPRARFLLRRRFPPVCSHARMRDAQVGVCTRVRERESARWARGMQYAFRESVSACASAYSVPGHGYAHFRPRITLARFCGRKCVCARVGRAYGEGHGSEFRAMCFVSFCVYVLAFHDSTHADTHARRPRWRTQAFPCARHEFTTSQNQRGKPSTGGGCGSGAGVKPVGGAR